MSDMKLYPYENCHAYYIKFKNGELCLSATEIWPARMHGARMRQLMLRKIDEAIEDLQALRNAIQTWYLHKEDQ